MSRLTRGRLIALRVRGCHPLWPYFPEGSACLIIATGLVRVRSPLLPESLLMSFPPGTEMFQFPAFATLPLCIQGKLPISDTWKPQQPPEDPAPTLIFQVP